jgi:hypothetical protein
VDAFLAACSRTTGRRILALDLASGRRVAAVLALTGEDPVDVGGRAWRAGPAFEGADPTPPERGWIEIGERLGERVVRLGLPDGAEIVASFAR